MSLPQNSVVPGGPVTDWVILGPFVSGNANSPEVSEAGSSGLDTDFLAPLGGEAHAELTPGLEVHYLAAPGRPRTARAQRVGLAGDDPQRPDFNHILDERHILEQDYDQATGYAFCHLVSPRAQKVYAYLGADGSTRVWLNGLVVYEAREQRKTVPWQHRFTLDLKPGPNALLLKVDNRLDWWGFQMEVWSVEEHLAGIRRALRGLSLQVRQQPGARLSVRVEPSPRPDDFEMPVRVRVTTEQGDVLAETAGRTGQELSLALPASCSGTLLVQATPADSGWDAVRPGSALLIAGDFAAQAAVCRARFAKVRARGEDFSPAWRPLYAGLAAWVARFLDGNFAAVDWRHVRTLEFIAALTADLERGVNFLASRPGCAMPLRFAGPDPQGQTQEGEYYFFLPPGYDGSRTYPLVLDLHGSGAANHKAPFDKNNLPNVAPEGAPVLAVCPVTFERGWRVDFLNALFADVKRRLAVDEDRVFLQGGSMGGKGAWDWVLANPEHFAAVSPKCGADGHPFRAVRLRDVAVWTFNGEKDLASYPFMPELMVTAVRRAGGEAQYTLFPHLAHGMGEAISKSAVKEWYLQHVRSHRPVAPDPLDALRIRPDGTSAWELTERPAQEVLALGPREELAYPQDNLYRAAVKLYQAYRKTSGPAPDRLADGYVFLQTMAGQPDGPWRALLAAPEALGAPEKGDLRAVHLPAFTAARMYCRGTWDDLLKARAKLHAELAAQGRRLTGEERAVILPTYLHEREHYWELLIGVAEGKAP